jgi:hypothetical protein
VIGAFIITFGALGNAITVRQPPAVIGLLVSLLAARWLTLGAAKRNDALAIRVVALLRLR